MPYVVYLHENKTVLYPVSVLLISRSQRTKSLFFSHSASHCVVNNNTKFLVTKTRKRLLLQNARIHSDMWSRGMFTSPFLNTICVPHA